VCIKQGFYGTISVEGKLEKFNQFLQGIQDRFREMTDGQKKQFVLACTVVFSAILTISVLLSVRGSGGEKKPDIPERLSIISVIPADEIFLPEEPDYIPGVLLERNQRASWGEQDAAEHWQDPLKFGEEQWREKIEAAIDEFLENVP
jgi:hypothetical protein